MKTVCPTCSRIIEPAEIRRVNFEEMVCPSWFTIAGEALRNRVNA